MVLEQDVKCYGEIEENKEFGEHGHCFHTCYLTSITILEYRRAFTDIHYCPETISGLAKVTDLGANYELAEIITQAYYCPQHFIVSSEFEDNY